MTKDEYLRWSNRRDTKRRMALIQQELAELMEESVYDPNSVDRTALETARRTGLIQGLRFALDPPESFEDDDE